ncbi:MAG: hypothetical protein E7242_01330 [Lachnospiraceae bacterium]|nr:hypothetical protein [Lachnospiraceae bacterium]
MNNTVFDDTFKTIIEKMPELVIPMVNEIFGQKYSYNEKLTKLVSEHRRTESTTIADSVFSIRERIYHIECQSYDDSTMAIRMAEYDFSIAIDNVVKVHGCYVMRFPQSAVIYIRHTASTPDELVVQVIFPDESKHLYRIPTVKLQNYTLDDIFEKDLLMVLPFFIIKYEKDLKDIASNQAKKHKFLEEFSNLMVRLKDSKITKDFDAIYSDLISLMQYIANYELDDFGDLKKEVGDIMGGKVLDLPSDKLREQFTEGKINKALEVYKKCIARGMSKEEALDISGLPEDKIPKD